MFFTGLIERVWVNSSAPCRVKSFRKAVSAVMDDLVKVLANKIIANLHLILNVNLRSNLALLQQ